jgi:hypothetical protein
MSRLRSAAVKDGSDSNPLRTIFIVVASIFFAWAQLAPFAGLS